MMIHDCFIVDNGLEMWTSKINVFRTEDKEVSNPKRTPAYVVEKTCVKTTDTTK